VSVGVKLQRDDELAAARIGFARQENAVKRGLPPRHRGGSRWGGHIEGACSELAASIALDLPWTGRDVLGEPPFRDVPDLGTATEVRWSLTGSSGLIYDPRRDHDGRIYVLVIGTAPDFTIVGYLHGQSCRRQEWLHAYPERTVYRVPTGALHQIKAMP
jgi:hypothetical protein